MINPNPDYLILQGRPKRLIFFSFLISQGPLSLRGRCDIETFKCTRTVSRWPETFWPGLFLFLLCWHHSCQWVLAPPLWLTSHCSSETFTCSSIISFGLRTFKKKKKKAFFSNLLDFFNEVVLLNSNGQLAEGAFDMPTATLFCFCFWLNFWYYNYITTINN